MTTLGPQAPVLANVASANSSTTLFSVTGRALGRTIYNDSTQVLYVALDGSVASSSNYTVQLAAGAYYEFPQPVVSGKVTGIWASANGNARVTSW